MPHKDPEQRRVYMRAWRSRNKAKLAEYARSHFRRHKEAVLEKRRRYRQRARHVIRKQSKAWLERNRERFKAWLKEYMARPEVILRNRLRRRERKAKDPSYGMTQTLRSRMTKAVLRQGGIKSKKSMELVGCSIQRLRAHLESQFEAGMTWENYGKYGWHIDHIRPCASFNLTKPEHQRICFHYSNLRPRWAKDNIRKGTTIAGELPLQYRLPSARR